MSQLLRAVASISEAWLLSLERTANADGGRAVHVISTVTEPGTEIISVRRVLDEALDSYGAYSVETVAETIFPVSLYPNPAIDWSPDLPAEKRGVLDAAGQVLYEAYADMLPLLRTINANKSGTYFSRMITWPGKRAGGVNQLAARVEHLRAQHVAGRRTNNTLDMDTAADAQADEEDLRGIQVYAATDRRTRGFPCLTHIDLTLYLGRLHMTAVYRHQYLIDKAYGNLLGLSWLLQFLCQQTGYEIGELVVHATLADAQDRARARTLAQESRAAFEADSLVAAGGVPVTVQPPLGALRSAWKASIEATEQAGGVGIDLVEVEALRQLFVSGGQSFLDAAWTNREQRDANRQPEALAGKWAAKEAVMKVLQHGIGAMDPRDVEIVTTPLGAPQVELHRAARAIAKRQRITSWHLSVTHEGGWAAAIAIACAQPSLKLVDSAGSTNERRNLG